MLPIRIFFVGILLMLLSACTVYPATYGGYYSGSVTRSRVVVGGDHYRPPPRVFIERNYYGHPRPYQHFYGQGNGHGRGHWGGHHHFH